VLVWIFQPFISYPRQWPELGIDGDDLAQTVNSTEFIYMSLCSLLAANLNRKPIHWFALNKATVAQTNFKT